MEQLTTAARKRVLDVLEQGRYMNLATVRPDGYPQATTVSYIHDGLILYVGIGLGSQKAHNIQANSRVSATINLPYQEWSQIRRHPPHFRRERERLSKEQFAAMSASQLNHSRAISREKLGVEPSFLAWPHGIAGEQMRSQARRSGHESALTLDNRNASATDERYALPRHMVVDQVGVWGLLRRPEHGPVCVR
jgi:hypothetical protein